MEIFINQVYYNYKGEIKFIYNSSLPGFFENLAFFGNIVQGLLRIKKGVRILDFRKTIDLKLTDAVFESELEEFQCLARA